MVEYFFFQTYYSYLKGNHDDTEMYFKFLKEEFKNKKDVNALTKKQLKLLKEVKLSLENGKIKKIAWADEDKDISIKDPTSSKIKQPELVKKIHTIKGSLEDYLNTDTMYLYNIEHPCGAYGAVDMVYQDKDTVYPVEVKTAEGKHDLIGQIAKYTLFFKLRLHLKMYFNVIPVTICNSYNAHTLKSLKEMSVVTLKYKLLKNAVKLSKV